MSTLLTSTSRRGRSFAASASLKRDSATPSATPPSSGDNTINAVAEAVRGLGRKAEIHAADLCDKGEPDRLAKLASQTFGRLDILINNAGDIPAGGLSVVTDKALRDALMPVLKGHFRPEFLNRIDEIIVFNALSRQNIRAIVQIQLDRVRRTAAAQDITLKMGEALVEHLVEEGYQPEFGARELKRQVRQMIETRLAKEILGDTLKSGDTVEVDFDKDSGTVTFNKLAPPATEGKASLSQEKSTTEKKRSKGSKGTAESEA